MTTHLTERRKSKWWQIGRLISTLGEKPQGACSFLRHIHLYFVTLFDIINQDNSIQDKDSHTILFESLVLLCETLLLRMFNSLIND